MIREKHELIWLSADDIAKQVGVSSMTIKRNCNIYEEFILFKQGGKISTIFFLNVWMF